MTIDSCKRISAIVARASAPLWMSATEPRVFPILWRLFWSMLMILVDVDAHPKHVSIPWGGLKSIGLLLDSMLHGP
jgi:hypothetical protein